VFEVKLKECMGVDDHYKIYVKVGKEQFFVKILKRDYLGCYAHRVERIYIGFNKKDIYYL